MNTMPTWTERTNALAQQVLKIDRELGNLKAATEIQEDVDAIDQLKVLLAKTLILLVELGRPF